MNPQPSSRSRFTNRSRADGFTLIELMIVIGIMAVVMAISVPSMYRTLERDSIRRATQDVLDIFQRARSRAIMTGQPVQLVIQPQTRVFLVMPLQQAEGMTEEDYVLQEIEKILSAEVEGDAPRTRDEDTMKLSDRMQILFIGVNFVADLQEEDMVPVRFYPNGTSDEFTMVIVSDSNQSRLFQLDVPTALLDWKVP
jgi:general secretion pathway protein H